MFPSNPDKFGITPVSSDKVLIKNSEPTKNLTQILQELEVQISRFLDTKVELGNSEGESVTILEAVEYLLNKVGNLTDKDLKTHTQIPSDAGFVQQDNLSFLGSSYSGVLIKNREGTQVQYVIDPTSINIPEGARLRNSRITLSGKPIKGVSKIYDSSSLSSSITVDPNRFPLELSIQLEYQTTSGTVFLEDKNLVTQNTEGLFRRNFTVKDISQAPVGENQEALNSNVLSSILDLQKTVSQLTDLGITDGSYLKVPDKSVGGVCRSLSGVVEDINNRLTPLEKFPYTESNLQGASTTKEGNLSEFVSFCTRAFGSCFSEINRLSTKVTELEGESKSTGTAGCLDC